VTRAQFRLNLTPTRFNGYSAEERGTAVTIACQMFQIAELRMARFEFVAFVMLAEGYTASELHDGAEAYVARMDREHDPNPDAEAPPSTRQDKPSRPPTEGG
jgi:hypothetical protein